MKEWPIQEDEFLKGYRGRIALYNDCSTVADIHRKLMKRLGLKGEPKHHCFLENVASALETSPRNVLDRHTLWPLLAPFIENLSDSTNQMKIFASSTIGAGLRLCPECVEADLQRLFFSYWRRSHQTPGQLSCAEHGCHLLRYEESTLCLEQPANVLTQSHPVPTELAIASTENWRIRLALGIAARIMEKQIALDRRQCSRAISTQAERIGLNPSAPRGAYALSRLAEDCFSLDWISEAMPMSRLKSGSIFNFVTGAFYDQGPRTSAMSIAICAAMVFDDVPTAMRALGTRTPTKSIQDGSLDFDSGPGSAGPPA
ncbi:hypothetical protein HNP55_001711 [Paucibacter oligotrophus]|uniref:TniQ domain-containing protein n=1 Tax=Roseateles oligotrophus TaxID=1769250 RepID=A0A840L943_9BURK|nr:TniQ family protein [Roseateles oligotrophus]MBB4843192.1 hypothetical protein [Roseateles oligotrophus]